MKRILLINENGGDNQLQLKRSLQIANKISEEDSSIKSIVFYIPTQNNTDPIEKLFGERLFKQIRKGLKLLDNGPGIRILTDKTLKNLGASDTVIISVYCGLESVQKANEFRNCKALITIPWIKDELNDWTETWEVEIVDENGDTNESNEKIIISNPVVQNAIEEFPSSRSVSHSSDKDAVASKFKILKNNGIQYHTDEISAYLLREKGWSQKDVSNVKDMGDKINDGRTIKAGDLTNEKESLQRWKN
jgi:hypothetical protein